MATRASTPKYEVVQDRSGTVALTGISKTDAKTIARKMGKGFSALPCRKLRAALDLVAAPVAHGSHDAQEAKGA